MVSVKVPAKFTRSALLRRYSAGSYIDGQWVDGVATDTPIRASIQPLTGNEYRLLPEGDRGKKGWKVFWNGTFSMGDEGIKPDELIVDGIIYRISNPDNWSGFGHSEATFIEATQ